MQTMSDAITAVTAARKLGIRQSLLGALEVFGVVAGMEQRCPGVPEATRLIVFKAELENEF